MLMRLKDILRPVVDIVRAGSGFLYDYYRYARYAGWRRANEMAPRKYKVAKIYHALEKSLSFRERNPRAGWRIARQLVHVFNRCRLDGAQASYQEKVAVNVLSEFCEAAEPPQDCSDSIKGFLSRYKDIAIREGGAINTSAAALQVGVLSDPELFFLSRHSVRDFALKPVDRELVVRALTLAMKTPSTCNRQAWHLYHNDSREAINQALRHQNGNKGFGHEVPCLLTITSDLRAFDNAAERYQHWIDGGMFAMAMVLALHALGVGTCCLNWSKSAAADLRARRALNISPAHSIVMMLAVGYPRETLKVCCSPRNPVDDVYSYLG